MEKDRDRSKIKKHHGSDCSLYDERDFRRYIKEAMTDLELERLEEHAESCDDCLRTLYRCQVALEKEKDEEFARRSIAIMDKLVNVPAGNLLEIIVKASGRLLELVSTTGELLRAPAFAPARGESVAEERTEPLRIVQEFAAPPISLQASLDRCREEGRLDLKISVYDREKEEFLSGIGVELGGGERPARTMTDEEGEASFRVENQGVYTVTLTTGGDMIGEISITLEMG